MQGKPPSPADPILPATRVSKAMPSSKRGSDRRACAYAWRCADHGLCQDIRLNAHWRLCHHQGLSEVAGASVVTTYAQHSAKKPSSRPRHVAFCRHWLLLRNPSEHVSAPRTRRPFELFNAIASVTRLALRATCARSFRPACCAATPIEMQRAAASGHGSSRGPLGRARRCTN